MWTVVKMLKTTIQKLASMGGSRIGTARQMSDCEERGMCVMTLNVCMLPLFLRNRDLPSQVTERSFGPISSCLDRAGPDCVSIL